MNTIANVDALAAIKLAAKELRHWQRDHGKDIRTEDALDGLSAASGAVAALLMERDALKSALQAVITIDVRGHQLQDRLQFSDLGRAILAQVDAALGRKGGAA